MNDNYELDSGNINMSAAGKRMAVHMFGNADLKGKDQPKIDGVLQVSGVPTFGGEFAKPSVLPKQTSNQVPMPSGGAGAVVTGNENFATTQVIPQGPNHGGGDWQASGYSKSPQDMFGGGGDNQEPSKAGEAIKKFFKGRDDKSMTDNITSVGGVITGTDVKFEGGDEGANKNKFIRRVNRYNNMMENQGRSDEKLNFSAEDIAGGGSGTGIFKSAKPGGTKVGNLLRKIF